MPKPLTLTTAEKYGATTEPVANEDEQKDAQDGQAAQKSQDSKQNDSSTTTSMLAPALPPVVTADEDTIVVSPATKPSIGAEKSAAVPDSEDATESEDAKEQDSLIVKLPVTLQSEDKEQIERMLVKLPISVSITDFSEERLGTWK
jgi:hypothetical protein